MATRGPAARPQTNRKDRLFCSHCNIPGHFLERCFKANPNLPVCSHCQIPGHTKEKCYKLNGFPLGHKQNAKYRSSANQSSLAQDEINHGPPITQEQYSQLLALLNPSRGDNTIPAANNVLANSSPMSASPHISLDTTHLDTTSINPNATLDIDNSTSSPTDLSLSPPAADSSSSQPSPAPSIETPVLRRSTRARQAPTYLHDFQCQQATAPAPVQLASETCGSRTCSITVLYVL
ncbi:hypothetical protein F0562_003690 [Nyssa sinensis]|uniref:CCHC-type domain-containing protein n=1 Tax=Nyssa sinensis TaxID=561372 RepID=A0A5J5BXT4_9ASTE|nr:hypothetical protein F0562_003690 [Nyssa sinensis]